MFRFALNSLFICVVCVALLVGAVRLFSPYASDYRDVIQRVVSQSLGKPITLGSIKAEWIRLDPYLILEDLAILDSETRNPLVTIKQVHASIDIFRSLLERSPRFHAIQISGANFTVIRDLQGKLMLSGFKSSRNNTKLIKVLNATELELISSAVLWHDELFGQQLRLEDVNLGFKSNTDSHSLIAMLKLPETMGKSLKLGMDFRGDLADITHWEGELYVDAQRLKLDSLPNKTLTERFGAKQGEVSLEGWSHWANGQPERWTGSIEIEDLHISRNDNVSSQVSVQEIVLPSLQTQFRWQKQQSGWLLDMDNLLLSSQSREWPRSGFNLDYHKSAESTTLTAAVDYLRVEDVLAVIASQDLLTPEFLQTTQQLAPSGDLSNFRVEFQNKQDSPLGYSASGDFASLNVGTTSNLPGLAGLQGTFNLDQSSGEAAVESHSLVFTYPQLFEDSLSANNLNARLRWLQTQNGITLLADRFSLTNSDIDVYGKLGMTLDGNSP